MLSSKKTSGPSHLVSEDEMRISLRENHLTFMHTVRKAFRRGVRRESYNLIQSAVVSTEHYRDNLRDFECLLLESPIVEMHVKPKTPEQAVMIFLLDARTKNDRNRANRQGRALGVLLDAGVAPLQIAKKLYAEGGVAGVLGWKDAPDDEDEPAGVADDLDRDEDLLDGDDEEVADDTEEVHTPWDGPNMIATKPTANQEDDDQTGPPAPDGYVNLTVTLPEDDLEMALEGPSRRIGMVCVVRGGPGEWRDVKALKVTRLKRR